jgi:hypothetical protein
MKIVLGPLDPGKVFDPRRLSIEKFFFDNLRPGNASWVFFGISLEALRIPRFCFTAGLSQVSGRAWASGDPDT